MKPNQAQQSQKPQRQLRAARIPNRARAVDESRATPPPQATQLSPWVVTLDALEPFRCAAPAQEPGVLPYLREADRRAETHLSFGVECL